MQKDSYSYFVASNGTPRDNGSKTLPKFKNSKSSVYSLHELSQKLELRSISISKTSKINHIIWEEVNSIFDSIFFKFDYNN